MRYYETLYIVNPNLEEDGLSKTMGEIGIELEKTKSKLINHRVWGKKRLAYPIHKQKYGSFILMQFEGGEQDQMVDFDTWMKLNNSVLRHMTVSLDEKPEVYVEEVKEEPAEETTEETTDEMDVAAPAEVAPAEESEAEAAEPESTEEAPEEAPEEPAEEVVEESSTDAEADNPEEKEAE
jgi:small subunit ribosomal protein S6